MIKKKSVLKFASILALSLFAAGGISAQTLFWENPKPLTAAALDSRFVQTAGNKNGAQAVFYEEIESASSSIYISLSKTWDGITFTVPKRIAGPFTYTGDVPEIYSACSTASGLWAAAALSSANDISVFVSSDEGETFSSYTFPEYEYPLIAPRIYETSNGNLILFVCLAKNEDFSILYSISSDGITWSEFTQFTPPSQTAGTSSAFAPYLVKNGMQDVVVYQQRYAQGDLLSFQIFSTTSSDNLASWSTPVLVTDSSSLLDEDTNSYSSFNCQRPYLFNYNSSIWIVYERKAFSSSATDIIAAQLGSNGKIKGKCEKLNSNANSSRPSLLAFNKSLYALWFDSQHGNESVYLAERKGSFWEDAVKLSQTNGAFASGLVASSKNLAFVWQEENGGKRRIMALVKDHSSRPPVLNGVSFKNGKRSSENSAKIELRASEDSSGVQGFSWIWTRDPKKEPEKKLTNISTDSVIENSADADGEWYLKARQLDYAGNWSDTATLTFYRDTTPPREPEIILPEMDKLGLMPSNTFNLSWKANAEDDDVEGFTWSLEYIDSIPVRLTQNPYHRMSLSEENALSLIEELKEKSKTSFENAAEPPRYKKNSSGKNQESYSNKRNGIYVFSVAAIDEVGNIGPATKQLVILNKYIPSTFITTVNSKVDDYGTLTMDIIGGGFNYEGSVSAVYVDRDGKAPYDYVLTASDGGFKISSDSRISGITIKEVEAGDYYVGLVHPSRGVYFTKTQSLNIREYGTIKAKNKFNLGSTWQSVQKLYKLNTNISTIIIVALLAFFIISITGTFIGLVSSAKEAAVVKAEVNALIQGGTMPNEKKIKVKSIKRKGLGLRIKLMLNLSLLVVLMSSVLIYTFRYILTSRQEETLSKALYDRTNIMMDSIESGTQVYLPLSTTTDNLSLQDTVNQISALNEAQFATITGFSEEQSSTEMDFVWATTDPQVDSRVDSETYIYGVSKITDADFKKIIQESQGLNQKAAEALGDIPEQLSEIIREAGSLLSKSDSESVERALELENIRKQLNTRLENILKEVAAEGSGSWPKYDPSNIDYDNTEYLFYKPVMYRRGSDQTYVHGMIFIKLSTESLIQELDQAIAQIRNISIAMILVAVLAAIVASILLSLIIVSPIKKLSNHVAKIRDTEDKEKLEGHTLKIRSRDEIGTLSDTVNEMTHGLVEAAKASKNLTLGKEIQTRFIPLKTDEKGNTLTTGELKSPGANFFSYYAGADELSGDYFDYKQIDKDHFAIIKCDVSGHGVPAALIMVEVATLFLNYFNHWDMKNPRQGTNLSPVVGQINDLLESRGFKGRFAAFTLAILNASTGECYFCNAGDNQVHIYDSLTRKKKVITLQETPAAGMFSTDLVDMKGGYKVSKLTLKKDDVLFLYTDGIEEAKRILRKPDGTVMQSDGTNRDEEKNEEFSPERVSEIIECVFDHKTYTLVKDKEGERKEEFTFDFTHAPADGETAIMALVSIEKVFRLYKNPKPLGNERVKVDKKIDEFLRQYFKNYGDWCSERGDVENDPTSLYYYGICEDPQYDDLTLVSVKKN